MDMDEDEAEDAVVCALLTVEEAVADVGLADDDPEDPEDAEADDADDAEDCVADAVFVLD